MPPTNSTFDAQLAVLCLPETKLQLEALAQVKMLNVSIIVRKVLVGAIPQMISQLSVDEKRAYETILDSTDLVEELEEIIRSDANEQREDPETGTGDPAPGDDSVPNAEPPSQF